LLVIPAIDVSEGQVVRLRRGEMAQRTVYSSDPAGVARRFQDQGAEVLHVVDLDGATAGEPRNLSALQAIAEAVDIPIQFGGGLRTIEAMEAALAIGVRWIILGTAAIANRALLREAVKSFGDAVIVALDARHGRVAIEGWKKTSEVDAVDLAREVVALGAQRLLCTDITADGMLEGPNIAGLRRIAEAVEAPVLASGGVASLEDIRALRALEPLGIIGVVVGRALYEGRLSLPEAIQAAKA
jgi:phosphoribosylformimino-5-aminoimidazole carboxamide ribotide isomerase